MVDLIRAPDVAKHYNLSLATVNLYVSMGLLRVADRKGTERLFDQEDVAKRMERIRELRKEGFLLRQIQQRFIKESV